MGLKYVSNCCKAEVDDEIMEMDYDHDDMPIYDVQAFCSKCHKPCKEIAIQKGDQYA